MGRGEHPRQNHHKNMSDEMILKAVINYILGVLEKYLKKLKLTGN